MEVRGGGQAFEDARTVKEHDYASDDDEKDAKRHQGSQASPRHAPAESKVPSPQHCPSSFLFAPWLAHSPVGITRTKAVRVIHPEFQL